MWLKGDKKGHDDNMFGEEYPHSSIPLEFGDSFKNGCDNVAGSVIQFPIIGDGVYDGSQEQGEDRVALKDLGDKKSALFCGLVTMRVCSSFLFRFPFFFLSTPHLFPFWVCGVLTVVGCDGGIAWCFSVPYVLSLHIHTCVNSCRWTIEQLRLLTLI